MYKQRSQTTPYRITNTLPSSIFIYCIQTHTNMQKSITFLYQNQLTGTRYFLYWGLHFLTLVNETTLQPVAADLSNQANVQVSICYSWQ